MVQIFQSASTVLHDLQNVTSLENDCHALESGASYSCQCTSTYATFTHMHVWTSITSLVSLPPRQVNEPIENAQWCAATRLRARCNDLSGMHDILAMVRR